MTLRVGLLINPWAGIGGPAGLKGSDGADIVAEALARGANPQAQQRVLQALQALENESDRMTWLTAGGDMGEAVCRLAGFEPILVGSPQSEPSTASDTERLATALLEHGVDVLLFAGGDGTARNIFNAVGSNLPVIGLPAGVKMHSGVYAVSPTAAALAIATLARGEVVAAQHAEVRDIDEAAFRRGIVKTSYYGDMLVPAVDELLQGVKSPGQAGEEEVLFAIAETVTETIDEAHLTVLGPGSTTLHICEHLGLEGSLLGVDVLKGTRLLQQDISEASLYELLSNYTGPIRLYITAIGGQGHIIGRGNQQLSARILRRIGRDNVCVVASRQKLASLAGKPFVIDSGDPELDRAWAGPMRVICDYREQVLYPLGRAVESGHA
ncbi:MAG TPA: ATP-NAD kinase family protein [Pseudomonadales bacterium]|nr:ATP-NAD kinase family protein [Pseudomonadales bacterium]